MRRSLPSTYHHETVTRSDALPTMCWFTYPIVPMQVLTNKLYIGVRTAIRLPRSLIKTAFKLFPYSEQYPQIYGWYYDYVGNPLFTYCRTGPGLSSNVSVLISIYTDPHILGAELTFSVELPQLYVRSFPHFLSFLLRPTQVMGTILNWTLLGVLLTQFCKSFIKYFVVPSLISRRRYIHLQLSG